MERSIHDVCKVACRDTGVHIGTLCSIAVRYYLRYSIRLTSMIRYDINDTSNQDCIWKLLGEDYAERLKREEECDEIKRIENMSIK